MAAIITVLSSKEVLRAFISKHYSKSAQRNFLILSRDWGKIVGRDASYM